MINNFEQCPPTAVCHTMSGESQFKRQVLEAYTAQQQRCKAARY